MTPIEGEQNLITVPCPKCGKMMGWPEGCPVDKNCNVCNDRHALAVKVVEALTNHGYIAYEWDEKEEVLTIIEATLEGDNA